MRSRGGLRLPSAEPSPRGPGGFWCLCTGPSVVAGGWGEARGSARAPLSPGVGTCRVWGVALRDPSCCQILLQLPRAGFLADGCGTF